MASEIEVKNPATGKLIQKISTTSVQSISDFFNRAKEVQTSWASESLSFRARKLLDLRECLINRCDELVELIGDENGKPKQEALLLDVYPTIHALTYFAKIAKKTLHPKPISLQHPILKIKSSKVYYEPLGIITVISPWNYPLFLPTSEIIMALVSGNAVIHKPSEITPLIGLKIQELCDEAGFPRNLVQTVIGDGQLGAKLIENKPDKVFFTGSVETGKKIAQLASKKLTPVNLEMGGKDPMIVLSDADLDFATSAALWGGYANSGQTCTSIERLIVQESIAKNFQEKLIEKIKKLRFNPTTLDETDLGSITLEKQKEVYKNHLDDAQNKKAEILIGGDFQENKISLKPTLIDTKNKNIKAYTEESFGPLIAMKTFGSIDEAIELANETEYGLSASVITSNLSLGEDIAKKIKAGSVLINETLYGIGLVETPASGMKSSGLGVKHSADGLKEFVKTKHIQKPIAGFATYKSFWWFPYTKLQYTAFRSMIEVFRRSFFRKLKALPIFLFNFTRYLKKEDRL